MDKKSSVGVVVVGYVLCLTSFPLAFNALIFYPFMGVRLTFPFIILIAFLLLGGTVLKFKPYARPLVQFIAVPYLIIGTQVLLSHRYNVDLASFASGDMNQQFNSLAVYRHDLVYKQHAIIAGEVVTPGFNIGGLIKVLAQLLGIFLLIFFNRPQVKEQFK